MRINCAIIVLLFLLPISINADEKISKQKMESQGKQRTYYLYAPASAKTAKSVPLIVLFHNTDRNGISLVEEWRLLADKEGFIVVGPDSYGPGWRTPEDGPEFLHNLVGMLTKKFSIDQSRIYLFGHSAGAVFALDVAMLDSEYFAAVAVHAGAWRTKREMSFIESAKRRIPVKIIIGDLDTSFPMTSVRETESALRDRLIPLEVTVLKGHDHWYYDKAPQINRSAWEFLKQTSLSK